MTKNNLIIKKLKKIKPVLPTGDKIIAAIECTEDKPTEDFILHTCQELSRITGEMKAIIKKYRNEKRK
jgi:hypothetical protein